MYYVDGIQITGILKLAKADYAHATLNIDIEFYAS